MPSICRLHLQIQALDDRPRGSYSNCSEIYFALELVQSYGVFTLFHVGLGVYDLEHALAELHIWPTSWTPTT